MTSIQDLLEDADHEEFAAALWFQMYSIALLSSKRRHGGSVPGKSPNIYRDYYSAHQHYMVKYFWPITDMRPDRNQRGPEKPNNAFERRFRIPTTVFKKLLTTVAAKSPHIRQRLRPNATGRLKKTSLLKVICALRQLSYGFPADLAEDMFEVSETTAAKCLEEFFVSVVKCFPHHYRRLRSENYLENIEGQLARAEFPGFIGCLDCAAWAWKNCPNALQGAMIRKDGVASVRMEVICSLDLWIWSFQFGLPGAMNNLNILEVRNYFSKVLSDVYLTSTPSYTVSGQVFDWFYNLRDGIYPYWKLFVKSLSCPTDRKSTLLTRRQERLRKCIERVFQVLFRRFKLLFIASELWSLKTKQWLANTCVCWHNMIVKSWRHEHCSDGAGGRTQFYNEEEDTTDIVFERAAPGDVVFTGHASVTLSDNIKLQGLYQRLSTALIEHVWSLHGART